MQHDQQPCVSRTFFVCCYLSPNFRRTHDPRQSSSYPVRVRLGAAGPAVAALRLAGRVLVLACAAARAARGAGDASVGPCGAIVTIRGARRRAAAHRARGANGGAGVRIVAAATLGARCLAGPRVVAAIARCAARRARARGRVAWWTVRANCARLTRRIAAGAAREARAGPQLAHVVSNRAICACGGPGRRVFTLGTI